MSLSNTKALKKFQIKYYSFTETRRICRTCGISYVKRSGGQNKYPQILHILKHFEEVK